MDSIVWLLLPLVALALVFLFYKAMSFSFPRMGIPRRLVIPVFVAILVGGLFNIPIWRSGSTTVAVNVGGAIIPLLISFYLLRKAPMLKTALAVAVVATVSGLLAEVDAKGRIGLQFGYLILPLVAVSVALILVQRNAPQVAFISGSVGGIIGVDLVHLSEAVRTGATYLSIGGRGVFDGIFTTAIVAAMLAGLPWRRKEVDGQEAE
jgi:uncharacterized membrane protein